MALRIEIGEIFGKENMQLPVGTRNVRLGAALAVPGATDTSESSVRDFLRLLEKESRLYFENPRLAGNLNSPTVVIPLTAEHAHVLVGHNPPTITEKIRVKDTQGNPRDRHNSFVYLSEGKPMRIFDLPFTGILQAEMGRTLMMLSALETIRIFSQQKVSATGPLGNIVFPPNEVIVTM